MKILILLTLTLSIAVACFKPVHSEVLLLYSQCGMTSGNNSYNVGDCDDVSVSYKFDDSDFYIGAGLSDRGITMASYEVWRYKGTELFGGIKSDLTKNISFFAQAGYVVMSNDIKTTGMAPEGIYYALNNTYGGSEKIPFVDASLENSNGISFKTGISITEKIGDNLKIGLTMAYQTLKIREVLRVKFKKNTDLIWAIPANRDLSGFHSGVSLSYAF